MKDNVAHKVRRYTSTTLHEYNVVLAGYVGSVVVPHVLVSAFPIQSFSRFFIASCDPLLITHYSLLLLASRVCFQLNEPLPREVILVVILLRGNELYELYEPNKPYELNELSAVKASVS